ncbi:MAG: hypothetical protein Q7K57_26070, partial [Burkholderiaceae bacterium]|nr:hypothetical protein [Burkholderiaceae bacterium]
MPRLFFAQGAHNSAVVVSRFMTPAFFAVLNLARSIFPIVRFNWKIQLITHHHLKAEKTMEFGVFILAQQRGYHQTSEQVINNSIEQTVVAEQAGFNNAWYA